MRLATLLTVLTWFLLHAGVAAATEPPTTDYDYTIIHYNRPAADYGDHTTGNFEDYWGLHLWGDAIDPIEVSLWESPKPFLAEDEFGRFAWIRRGGTDSQVNFIIHQGNDKDTDLDRMYDAEAQPEIWINAGDPVVYTSQADAQGFVTVRYHRDDGDYGTPGPDFNTFWGLHLWGDGIDPAEATSWPSPKPPTGIDAYGAFWRIQIVDSSQPVNYIIHRGDTWDPGADESFVPAELPTVWKQSGDVAMYASHWAAEDKVVIHYHRDDGDYGDPSSSDFNDYWGLHAWNGAASPPTWTDPITWDHLDVFGAVFEADLLDGALEVAYIIHRGDTKDPGPDQFLVFADWGHEVWQLEGADVTKPYVYPLGAVGPPPDADGDGVVDDCDQCPGTTIPESTVPGVRLGNNRFALVDGDDVFDTVRPGRGPVRSYSLTETAGCSCEQILSMQGLGGGQIRFGCSIGTMEDWIALIAGSPAADGAAALDRTRTLRTELMLKGNYPNPFSPRTTIRFDLPEAMTVRLAVYDVQGRRVQVLADGPLPAGRHEVPFDGGGLASGWYLARLETPQGHAVQAMQLVK